MDLTLQSLVIITVIVVTKKLVFYFTQPTKGPLRRPLGSAEEHVHRRLLASNEPNTARALGVEVKAGFTLKKDHVLEALRLLKARHASLQVTIQENSGKFWFVPFHDESKIPYTEKNSNNWIEEVETALHENSTTFEGDLLWKVTRLHSTDKNGPIIFIFAIHHAIMDGLSMSHLMVEFAEILNGVANGKYDISQSPVIHDHLLQPSEHYLFKNRLIKFWQQLLISIVDTIPVVFQKFLAKRIMNKFVARLTPDKQATKEIKQIFDMFKIDMPGNEQRRKVTTIFPVLLSQEETRKIIVKTKENKSTCYGVIVAASSLALAELIEEMSGSSIERFESKPLNKTRTTVNLRRYFDGEVPNTYMGMYLGFCSQDVEINFGNHNKRELLFETALKFSKDIQQSLKEKTVVSLLVAFSLMKNLAEEVTECMSKAKEDGVVPTLLVFNNYGAVGSKPQEQQQQAEDRLVEATSLFNVVTEHNTPLAPLFTVNCVTINGRMSIGVLYYTHQTTREITQKFAHKLKNILISL